MRSLFYILLWLIINLISCEYLNMNYIIDNIYLGDSEAAADEEYLKQYNIKAVVNCAEDITSEYEDLKFLELKLYDTPEQEIIPKFEVAYKFIKRHSKNYDNILIHCAAGVSRSASLVVFYLMKEKHWDYDTCFWYIVAIRPVISPNYGFAAQLRTYYFNNIENN